MLYFGPDPEKQGYGLRIELKFGTNNGTDNTKILINMQNFKLLAILLLEILRHKVTPFQKGTSHRDSIFTPWNRGKFDKSVFITGNIFSGPKLYSPIEIDFVHPQLLPMV